MTAPRIPKATGRSVAEWIGKNPDDRPPAHVILRVLRRQDNKCALTGIIIADGQPVDADHIVRLEDKGENRESNLQIVLRLPHEVKSAAERKRAAKADRIAKRAHSIDRPKAQIQSRGFDTSAKKPKIEKQPISSLGPSAWARRFTNAT